MAAQTTEGAAGESEYRHRQNQRPRASGLLRGNAAVLQDDEARSVQRQRVADNYPGADAYYSAVLTLFGGVGINTVFVSRRVVNYNLTGTEECASSH